LLGRCQVLDAADAEPDGIIDACTRALEADPSAAAFVARAAARQRTPEGDPLAATDYDKALELDPTALRAALARAWIAMLAEESDALSRSTSLLERFPDDPAVRALAGELALNAGQKVAARKHFQRALEVAPADWNSAARARKVVDALSP
jgi:Flp pilus assembly protein TadD